MKDEYIKYQEYKKSDIKFIDSIPNHWETWKVRHGFNIIGSGTTPKSDNPDFYNGEIPWITTSELRESLITDTNQKVTKLALDKVSSLKLYNPGAIAIAMYGATIGRLGIFGIKSTVNQACCVYDDPTKFYPKFLFYWLWMSRKTLIAFSVGGGQPNLSQDDLKQLHIPIPQIPEQTQIANFLDHKTRQIDRLIEQKEKLLKLLTEKRTAIITQAVTKGLDPNVEMKNSGIDWLGEIPKHWIPKRLKFLTSKIIDGTHSTPEYISEGVPFLRVTDIVNAKGAALNTDAFKYISHEEHEELTKRCNPEVGDLLYSKNGTIGIPSVIDWDFDFSIFVSLCLIKIKKDLLIPSFLSYSLQSKLTENQISIGSKKSAVINLHLDKIKEFVIPYPPMEEQIKINNWLNEQLPKFNDTEKKLLESINQLKEYREALITAAVTGQIDVRKEVVNE